VSTELYTKSESVTVGYIRGATSRCGANNVILMQRAEVPDKELGPNEPEQYWKG
jgi:hypothetical protein